MPFRATFQCLWCGRVHRTRTTADLEGWAMLCPECLGRAGENDFLRFRLKRALAERSREERPSGLTEDAARSPKRAVGTVERPAELPGRSVEGPPEDPDAD